MATKTNDIKIPKLPHGEGTISLHKSGRLTYKKTIKLPDGKSKRLQVYGETVKDVMSKMKTAEKENIEGQSIFTKETLAQAIRRWLIAYKLPKLKPTSFDRCEITYRNQILGYELAMIRWNQINSDDIQLHLNKLVSLGLSWSTIKKTYDLLNEFYKFQVMNRMTDMNPVLCVSMPSKESVIKKEKEIQYLDEDDLQLFIREATKQMKSKEQLNYTHGWLLVFDVYTGLRVGELLALRWRDIDFEKRTVTVNKSIEKIINRDYDEDNVEEMEKKGITKYIKYEGSTKTCNMRIVPLNDKAMEAIKQHKEYSNFTEPDDYVCTTDTGDSNNLRNLGKSLGAILARAGTKTQGEGIHMLRHTCASLMFRHDIPVEIIASILGHSAEVCRRTYLHFALEQQTTAMNKMIINF